MAASPVALNTLVLGLMPSNAAGATVKYHVHIVYYTKLFKPKAITAQY